MFSLAFFPSKHLYNVRFPNGEQKYAPHAFALCIPSGQKWRIKVFSPLIEKFVAREFCHSRRAVILREGERVRGENPCRERTKSRPRERRSSSQAAKMDDRDSNRYRGDQIGMRTPSIRTRATAAAAAARPARISRVAHLAGRLSVIRPRPVDVKPEANYVLRHKSSGHTPCSRQDGRVIIDGVV